MYANHLRCASGCMALRSIGGILGAALTVLVCATVALFSDSALAAQDTGSRTASDCVLAAQDAKSGTTSDCVVLDPIVVTASGTKTQQSKAPASITSISAEEIAKTAAVNLTQALQRSVGVTLNRGSGNLNRVQLRGLPDSYVLILINGRRVNSNPNLFRGNDFDLDWVDLDTVERVEVVRGPMSSLYGADATGGVINIITKKPSNVLSGSITAGYTSQENPKAGDSYRTSFTLSGPIGKRVSFRLSGGYNRREKDADDINPPHVERVKDKSGKWIEVQKYSEGFQESRNSYLDTALSLALDNGATLDFGYDYSNREHYEIPLIRHGVHVAYQDTYSWGTSEVKLYADRIKNSVGNSPQESKERPNTSHSYGLDARINSEVGRGILHKLTAGLSLGRQEVDDHFNFIGDGQSSVWNAALFAEDQMQITQRLSVTFGTRLDRHENYGTRLSPRLYGVYALSDRWTVKGGVSTGFKAPTLLQMSPGWYQISCGGGCYLVGSKDLKPEKSVNTELALHYDSSHMSFGATLFNTHVNDMIQWPPARTGDKDEAKGYSNYVGLSTDGKPMFKMQNLKAVTTRGVELTLSADVSDTVTITGNYTHLDSKVTKKVERPLAYQPKDTLNLRADWQVNDRLQVSLAGNYVSKQFTYVPDSGNLSYAETVASYATTDLLARYDLSDNVTLQGGILNVADHTLTRSKSHGDDFNTEGRRFFVALTRRF